MGFYISVPRGFTRRRKRTPKLVGDIIGQPFQKAFPRFALLTQAPGFTLGCYAPFNLGACPLGHVAESFKGVGQPAGAMVSLCGRVESSLGAVTKPPVRLGQPLTARASQLFPRFPRTISFPLRPLSDLPFLLALLETVARQPWQLQLPRPRDALAFQDRQPRILTRDHAMFEPVRELPRCQLQHDLDLTRNRLAFYRLPAATDEVAFSQRVDFLLDLPDRLTALNATRFPFATLVDLAGAGIDLGRIKDPPFTAERNLLSPSSLAGFLLEIRPADLEIAASLVR
ncbi:MULTISPECIES: hypothetical protein [Nocardia]|uniref:hypothetical protein n=1 Tax=Nocardia TaxID=1817 RepID=UPI0007EADEEE|nr:MULTISPECIES: hypothetical protein [Nocardia]MBF6278533.1 hypothetical protein [Nocardia nova]OBA44170.1 hypothetical protein A5789_09890 [Nocardia sp. 852002-51101_SCH5132738]OBB49515.1 hypothetical protein A5748_19675 [Nocardia sp. 852002-51244_SCH5132740]OBF64961.1 hypothetical protein A9X06_08665 [Mycobacterium sp. 852002-51759_SCH5129042]